MTSIDLDTIHKALRNVPEFDGNPNILVRFLNLCDQLVTSYVQPTPGNELINLSLLNGIINKITGPAARILATNGTPTTWEGIRNALTHNFSDQRDESALYTDLSMLTQGSDTPHIFYERVQNLLGTIMTYVQLHDTLSTTVEAKRTLYKKLALQSYLRGLNEPVGSRIRCMRPDSLEDALKFAHEELNVMYMQSKTRPSTSRNPTPFKPNFAPQNSGYVTIPPNAYSQVNPTGSQSMYRNMPQNVPTPFYSVNQSPSRTQQIFKTLPRSNMSTGFKIPPKTQNFYQNINTNKINPQPMSGVSHPVARTLPPIKRDFQSHSNAYPNYRSREMNLNEFYSPYNVQSYDVPFPYDISHFTEAYPETDFAQLNEFPPQIDYSYEQNDFYSNPDVNECAEQNFHQNPSDNTPT